MISYEVQAFGAPLVRAERATPAPEGSEVLLQVLAAGVCHTDIHTWHGWYDMGGGKRLAMADRGVSLPLTLGHEIAGKLLAVGPDSQATGIGKNYLVYPWIGCGSCKVCRRGQEQLCPTPRFLGVFRAGGYSDHVLLPDARYLIDIGDMPPERAAPYACSGLTTFSAINKIPLSVLREERVVVIGAGGLGLMCIALLNALGSAGAVAVEMNAGRREAAMAAGAVAAIDPASPDAVAQIKNAAGGAAWAVIDCVGSSQTVQLSLDLLVKGGQLILVGLFGGEITIPVPIIPIRAISIEGSYVGSIGDLRDLMTLVQSKQIRQLPTTCCDLHEAPAALGDLELGKVVGRVIIRPAGQH